MAERSWERGAAGSALGTREVTSFCRLCPASCGIRVTVEGDRIAKVMGDSGHPLSSGYTCPKGRALGQLHHSLGRLDGPLVGRAGDRRAASWEEWLDHLAARLASIVEESGPDAVAFYSGTGGSDAAAAALLSRLIKAIGTRSFYSALTIDGPAKPLVWSLMAGQPGLFATAIDYGTVSMALFVGTNPVISHGHASYAPNPRRRLGALAAHGELWVVDPRRTETARMATRHLAVRPGTDHVWLAAVVREMLATADLDELAERAIGIAELAAAVDGYTLDGAARACDIDRRDLENLVSALRRHGRFCGMVGTGSSMSPSANLAQWLMNCLTVITDSADRPGGTWFNPGFIRRLDDDPASWRFVYPGEGPRSRPELTRRFGQMPAAALVDEIERGNVRAVVVTGGNLVGALPGTQRTSEALGSVEVLAVLDVRESPTTDLATHVAAVAGQLERADVGVADQYLPAVAGQYTPAVVPVGANRKPQWWIEAEIARRLGHDIMPPGSTTDTATDDDILESIVRHARADLPTLKARPTAVVAQEVAYGWVLPNVARLGGWRLAPPELVAQLESLPLPDDGLLLIPRRQLPQINSLHVTETDLRGSRDAARLLMHPKDAEVAGVRDGHEADVVSAHGAVRVVVAVDEGIRAGAVSVPHGFAGADVNRLTSAHDTLDALTGMPAYSAIPVTVLPVH